MLGKQLLRWQAFLLACLMVFVVACSSEEPVEEVTESVEVAAETAVPDSTTAPEETAESEDSAEISEPAEATTRSFTDAMERTVEIPVDPQRIVVMSEIDLDSLLALGVMPIGAPNGRGQLTLPTYMLPQIDGNVTSIGGLGEPNLETILTLEPDLILFSDPWGAMAEMIPELEQIAPLVVPYVDEGDWHWKDVFMAIGGSLELSAEADAYMSDYDARTAALAEQHANSIGEVSIVRWMSDGPRILLDNAFSSDVLSDVGFTRPQEQMDLRGSHPVHTDVISMEQIEVLSAEIIFAGGLNPDGDVALTDALADPLVQNLPAVQADRFFQVDGLRWSSTGGPTAAMQVLDDVADALFAIESAAAVAGEGFPVTIEHKFGSTTFDAKPERIVSIGYNEQDPLLALGEKPQAVRYWYGDAPHAIFPWAQDEADGHEPVVMEMTFGELNYEQILNFNPDMISAIYSGISAEEFMLLSQIAPTLAQSGDFDDFGMPWQDTTESIATALGAPSRAATLIASVENTIADAIADNPEFADKTIAVAYSNGDGTYGFYSEQDPRSRFFTDFGFVIPEEMTELVGDSFFASVSQEALAVLDQDLIVFLGIQFLEGGAHSILNDPLINQLDAMKEGRFVIIPDELDDAFQFNTVLSLDFLIKGLVPELATALSSDPMAESDAVAIRTLDIEHELGITTIDSVPERIVVLEYSFADNLGSLGVAPVGFAVDAPPDYIYTITEEMGAVEVGTRAEPNLEAIIGLNPDLIIGDLRRHEAIYEQLSEIAPTVIFNSLRGSYQDQLDTFVTIAEVMDMDAEAADMLADYEETFAAAQAETDSAAGEYIIGVLWSGGYTAHSNESFMGSLLESLGRTNALETLDGETQYLLDMEGFAAVNPSTIVIMCNPADQSVLDEMADSPLWQAFDAVVNDRVYTFDRNLWSKGRGLIAFEQILADAIESGLLGNTESSSPVCGG